MQAAQAFGLVKIGEITLHGAAYLMGKEAERPV